MNRKELRGTWSFHGLFGLGKWRYVSYFLGSLDKWEGQLFISEPL